MENELEAVSRDAVYQLSHSGIVATTIQSLGGRYRHTGSGVGLGGAPYKTALSSFQKAFGALMKIRPLFPYFWPSFRGSYRV